MKYPSNSNRKDLSIQNDVFSSREWCHRFVAGLEPFKGRISSYCNLQFAKRKPALKDNSSLSG